MEWLTFPRVWSFGTFHHIRFLFRQIPCSKVKSETKVGRFRPKKRRIRFVVNPFGSIRLIGMWIWWILLYRCTSTWLRGRVVCTASGSSRIRTGWMRPPMSSRKVSTSNLDKPVGNLFPSVRFRIPEVVLWPIVRQWLVSIVHHHVDDFISWFQIWFDFWSFFSIAIRFH